MSTLLAWFALNAAPPDGHEPPARSLTYAEIPEHFVWVRKDRVWRRRQRKADADKVIRRMFTANPSEGPRFYLYLLLLHRKGATSFEDLVTIQKEDGTSQTFFEQKQDDAGEWQNTENPHYRLAAQELGLLASDDENERTLQDAAQYQVPSQLRQLFAHVLLHCEVSKPAALFQSVYEDLSEDFRKRAGLRPEEVRELTLLGLQDVLGRAGVTLETFQLPLPKGLDVHALRNRDIEKETCYDREEERARAAEQHAKMYPEQARAFEEIIEAVSTEKPGFFFIDGPGGCGKTFLYEALLHEVRGQGHIALACAWSGIAAVLLEGGLATRASVFLCRCHEEMSPPPSRHRVTERRSYAVPVSSSGTKDPWRRGRHSTVLTDCCETSWAMTCPLVAKFLLSVATSARCCQ